MISGRKGADGGSGRGMVQNSGTDPFTSEAGREGYASAQCSHEEQRDHSQTENQTQDAGAAVLLLDDTHQAQNDPERCPQE